jgi:signal transduction histidine kinase
MPQRPEGLTMPKGFRGRAIAFSEPRGAAAPAAQGLLARALEPISRIAYEAPSVEAGLAQLLDTLCEALHWPIGHVYHLADDEAPALTSAAIWHLDRPERFAPFQESSEQIVFAPGRGLVGAVLAQRRPGLSPDVSRDRRFLRRRAAEATGVRAWLAFPVVADDRVVAVCECFSTERVALDPAIGGLLSCAGLALGRLYERERWRAERDRLLHELADGGAGRARLSALAGAIAHEINSPLFAARACLSVLAADEPGEPLLAGAQAELARIAAVLERLDNLARQAPVGQSLDQFTEPPAA